VPSDRHWNEFILKNILSEMKRAVASRSSSCSIVSYVKCHHSPRHTAPSYTLPKFPKVIFILYIIIALEILAILIFEKKIKPNS